MTATQHPATALRAEYEALMAAAREAAAAAKLMPASLAPAARNAAKRNRDEARRLAAILHRRGYRVR